MLESNTNFIVVGVLSIVFIVTLILLIVYGDKFKKCPEPNCLSQCNSPFNTNSQYAITVTDPSTNTLYSLVQYIFTNTSNKATWGQLGVINNPQLPNIQNTWTILCQNINGQTYIGIFAMVAGQLYSLWSGSKATSGNSSGISTNSPGDPPIDPTFSSWFLLQPDPNINGNYLLFLKGQQLVIDVGDTSQINNNNQTNSFPPLYTTSSPTQKEIGSFTISPL